MIKVAVRHRTPYALTEYYHVPGRDRFLAVTRCHYPVGDNHGDGNQYTAWELPRQGATPQESQRILQEFSQSSHAIHWLGRPENWSFPEVI
jgi:hypothetical protein